MHDQFRVPLKNRPTPLASGDPVFGLSERLIKKRSETSLIAYLICQRRLFGWVYSGLLPSYFRMMPRDSGVFIGALVRTGDIVSTAAFPGDIDLLIIPYEDDHLIVDQTLALEVKIVRASYVRQGKSPNDFGFSQASALLELGFPYAAVAHLIVSDTSPTDAWRQTLAVEILDGDTGRVSLPQSHVADLMPMDLIERTYGRLCKHVTRPELGMAAVYIDDWRMNGARAVTSTGLWMPECREATANAKTEGLLMQSVADYYDAHYVRFLQTPRYDP